MSIKANGGPAFPTPPEHRFNSGMPGMTLRDYYYAAKAMPVILAHLLANGLRYVNVYEIAAKAVLEQADALIEASK